jgi:hypothetical protein
MDTHALRSILPFPFPGGDFVLGNNNTAAAAVPVSAKQPRATTDSPPPSLGDDDDDDDDGDHDNEGDEYNNSNNNNSIKHNHDGDDDNSRQHQRRRTIPDLPTTTSTTVTTNIGSNTKMISPFVPTSVADPYNDDYMLDRRRNDSGMFWSLCFADYRFVVAFFTDSGVACFLFCFLMLFHSQYTPDHLIFPPQKNNDRCSDDGSNSTKLCTRRIIK